MVDTIYIYYEGDKKLQPGFRKFFDSFYHQGFKIRLVAGGTNAIADFVTGMKTNRDSFNILLKDSEGLSVEESLVKVRSHDHWENTLDSQVDDDQLHFMVQVMESWFLADLLNLRQFYGQGFLDSRLPGNARVEEIPRNDVQSGLNAATAMSRKGKYHKTRHAPELLATLDTAKVRSAAPGCDRLFRALEQLTA